MRKNYMGVRKAFLLIAVVLVLWLAGCAPPTSPSTPTPAPTPTPTPTKSPVDKALEELFWIAADVAGISRTVDFKDARYMLENVLFVEYERKLKRVESYGVAPFSDWPYCINAISGAMSIASLGLARSPVEAAPHVNNAIETITMLDTDIQAATEFGRGTLSRLESKRRCDEFEQEKRRILGWPSTQPTQR
ncbi:MAG: hypothetical protein HY676_03900 [Chloroflexi bacterium]|nr:hypothetical protein [Chloroflexota bacterium]